MRRFCRKVVGLLAPSRVRLHDVKPGRGHFALLSCGHMGEYAQPRDIGKFQFCAVCAQPKEVWKQVVR